MNGSTAFGLLALLALVLANGFFVATEFALVAVRRSRLEQLAREGNARARLAHQMVKHLDAYIAACQLGITMASLALSRRSSASSGTGPRRPRTRSPWGSPSS